MPMYEMPSYEDRGLTPPIGGRVISSMNPDESERRARLGEVLDANLPVILLDPEALGEFLLVGTGYKPWDQCAFFTMDEALTTAKTHRAKGTGTFTPFPPLLLMPELPEGVIEGNCVAVAAQDDPDRILGTMRITGIEEAPQDKINMVAKLEYGDRWDLEDPKHEVLAAFLNRGNICVAADQFECFDLGKFGGSVPDDYVYTAWGLRQEIVERGWAGQPVPCAHLRVAATCVHLWLGSELVERQGAPGMVVSIIGGKLTRPDDLESEHRFAVNRINAAAYLGEQGVPYILHTFPPYFRYADGNSLGAHLVARAQAGITDMAAGRWHGSLDNDIGPLEAHRILETAAWLETAASSINAHPRPFAAWCEDCDKMVFLDPAFEPHCTDKEHTKVFVGGRIARGSMMCDVDLHHRFMPVEGQRYLAKHVYRPMPDEVKRGLIARLLDEGKFDLEVVPQHLRPTTGAANGAPAAPA